MLKSIACKQSYAACSDSYAGPSEASVFTGVHAISSTAEITALRSQIDALHAQKVVDKVCAANPNECMTQASDIWRVPTDQTNTSLGDHIDIDDFVLIKKGDMQLIADTYRDANHVECDTRGVGTQLDDADCIYLAEANIDNIKTQIDAVLVANDTQVEASSEETSLADLTEQVEFREQRVSTLFDKINSSTEENDVYKTYWQALEIAADGQAQKVRLGNGVETSWTYDQGRVNSIRSGLSGEQETVQQVYYQFDSLGNLQSRDDYLAQLDEIFSYDDLNRLTATTMFNTGASEYTFLGLASESFSYDELGNITFKSGIGSYSYQANNSLVGVVKTPGRTQAGPHAVTNTDLNASTNASYTYDANGNQLAGNGRTITWSSYNKPLSIDSSESGLIEMEYGPGRALVKQVNHQDNTTTLYVGSGFEQVTKDTTTTNRHHISVAGQTIAVLELSDAASPRREHYLHRDHQDSIVAITDHTGSVVERNFYDAFGKKRSAIRTLENTPMLAAGFFPVTERGYTGHRQLSPDVVHMNGRIYDPNLGRFLSADPHIQSPLNSQSLNRYSYVLNNPLSFVDPSGFFLKSLFKHLKRLFKAIVKIIKQVVNEIIRVVKSVLNFIQENWKMIAAIAAIAVVAFVVMNPAVIKFATGLAKGSVLGGKVVLGAIGGGLSGMIMTGSIKGMLIGAISGAAFAGIGNAFSAGGKFSGSQFVKTGTNIAGKVTSKLTFIGRALKTVLHGLVGGAQSVLSGGKFKTGFSSAAFAQYAAPSIDKFGTSGRRIMAAGVVGGVGAELAGGGV